jgi:non-specific serine/threonine protein kinase
MATGRLPFPGDTSAVVFDAILNREAAPFSDAQTGVPPEFRRILDKALEKDRNLRYQTATDLKTDVARLKRDIESGRRRAADMADSRGAAKQPEKSIAVLYFENLSGSRRTIFPRRDH